MAATLGIWAFLFSIEEDSTLKFIVFDIGQGDALFIETPDHYRVLIDGGPDAKVVQKLGEVMPFWARTIDLVILTHPHADHAGGLPDVLERYKVRTVIESQADYGTAEYAAWQKKEMDKKIISYAAISGTAVFIGKYAHLKILTPFESVEGKSFKNVHDANIASELDFGKIKILLMGDAEDESERELLRRGALADIDILKVGHHGSKTSSAEAFLKVVKPEVAVISVGRKNRYGHPYEAVLKRLQDFGARILRTDTDGDIKLTSDGVSWAPR